MPEMNRICEEIRASLLAAADPGYRTFQLSLMPGVDPARVIGVRTPVLRKLAAVYAKHPHARDFLDALPHEYYDENNLHGFILCRSRDFDETVARLDAFLPYVDNWATCDLLRPAAFERQPEKIRPEILRWMSSDAPYTVRFGMEMAMTFLLDAHFDPSLLRAAAEIRSDEYYVRMMIAWYVATALAKQWDATLPLITDQVMDPWTHNKAIQKARESYRITDTQKALLASLKL